MQFTPTLSLLNPEELVFRLACPMSSPQAKTTDPWGVIAISTAKRAMGCLSDPTDCPAEIGTARFLLLSTSPSCEEKPSPFAEGRTASLGAAETAKRELSRRELLLSSPPRLTRLYPSGAWQPRTGNSRNNTKTEDLDEAF